MTTIDINCDVGEGVANEHLLMQYISSCNIACGGHFGNEKTIDETIRLALKSKVKIGAHPSFPDTKNFGRKVMNISNSELRKSLDSQLQLFKQRVLKQKGLINHVKPHGALYNLVAKDKSTATILVDVIKQSFENIKIYVPYNSVIEKVAKEHSLEIVYEAFADRNYNEDLSLVSRLQKNAVITDPKLVYNHLYSMINKNKVATITNTEVIIKASTFCVHGDNKNALEILREVTQLLKKQNIQVV